MIKFLNNFFSHTCLQFRKRADSMPAKNTSSYPTMKRQTGNILFQKSVKSFLI